RPESPRLGELGLERPEEIPRAVRGAIIDDDDLLGDRDGLDALEDLGEREPLVVNGDDNGEPKGGLVSHRGHYSKRPCRGPRRAKRGAAGRRGRARVTPTRRACSPGGAVAR